MDDTIFFDNVLGKTMIESIKVGNEPKIREMLDADPQLAKSRDQEGVSALLWAVYTGKKEVVELLLSKVAPSDIFEACACGDLARVESLPMAGNGTDYSADGWTPLHLAAAFGHVEIVAALVKKGVDVHQRSKNYMNNTPLNACVAISRSRDIAELLLQNGADVDARQSGGFTALHEAASAGDADMCRLLIDYGADLTARTDEGKTPLDLAHEKGKVDVVEALSSGRKPKST